MGHQEEEGGEGPVARVLREDAMRRDFIGVMWEWTRSLAVAFVLFLLVRTFAVEAFRIPTSSMENTLLVGDFLLVNKAVYGAEIPGTELRIPAFTEPEWGDVVVFVPPHEPGKNYVKRVVGVGGDTIEMREKVLHRNGVPVEEPYARYLDVVGDAAHPDMGWQVDHLATGVSERYRPTRDNWGPLEVPPGHFFVLGDNRDNSEDSRYWGFVARDAMRGRPWFVYYSFVSVGAGQLPWLRSVRWGRIGEPVG